MSDAKQSPTPWAFGGPVRRDAASVQRHPPLRSEFWEIGVEGDRFPPGVAAVNSEADAAFIVTAVNNHADLLAVCGEMLAELEREYGHGVANGYWPDMKPKLERWRAILAGVTG